MKRFKLFSTLLCVMVLLGFSVTAYAASQVRGFNYEFKHQLSVSGTYKANRSTAHFYIFTSKNDGKDTYFTIKQYKYKVLGTNTYQRQANISCQSGTAGSCYLNTTSGTKYTYEFWKPTAVGYVKGSGRLTY